MKFLLLISLLFVGCELNTNENDMRKLTKMSSPMIIVASTNGKQDFRSIECVIIKDSKNNYIMLKSFTLAINYKKGDTLK